MSKKKSKKINDLMKNEISYLSNVLNISNSFSEFSVGQLERQTMSEQFT